MRYPGHHMHLDWPYTLSGFLVGGLVGVTGVGGGSLMTPILVLLFGVNPAAAVGTDLLFAAVTKGGGASRISVDCSARDERIVPQTYVDYEERPREFLLAAVNSVVDIHTRVAHLYSAPYSQVSEQLRLTIEIIKERQESELINNPEYGLLTNAAPEQRITTRGGAPTPDDLDELLTRVWKEPGFFLAHPLAIAAFGRECTRRGVPPPTVSMFGSQFITWRGVPLIPSNKVPIEGNRTSILLIRTGQSRQGVIGLYQPNLPGVQSPGLSVRFMGINLKAIASYLISLYCSLAVLTDDALGVLDGVEIDRYHTYSYPSVSA